jgi:hypothetical protein
MDLDDIVYWLKKVYFVFIVIIGVCILISNTLKWPIAIDITEFTLALLLILMLAPILNRLSKVKIGNILEAELTEEFHKKAINLLETTESRVVAPEIDQGTGYSTDVAESAKKDFDKYQYIINTSSPLAGIVKLRINLEKSLSELYSIRYPDKNSQFRGAGSYITPLLRAEMISGDLAASLRKVIDIANSAIHGKGDIRDEDIQLAILAGVNVLRRVDNVLYKYRPEKRSMEREIVATPHEIY